MSRWQIARWHQTGHPLLDNAQEWLHKMGSVLAETGLERAAAGTVDQLRLFRVRLSGNMLRDYAPDILG